MTRTDDASRQRPAPGEIVLDHVAHFLPDMTTAEEALDRLGLARHHDVVIARFDSQGAVLREIE
jgi:hypothetical protein